MQCFRAVSHPGKLAPEKSSKKLTKHCCKYNSREPGSNPNFQATWRCYPQGASFTIMKYTRGMGSWDRFPRFQRVAEARQHMSGESLHGSNDRARGPERPLNDTVKMEPKLCLETPRN